MVKECTVGNGSVVSIVSRKPYVVRHTQDAGSIMSHCEVEQL